MLYQKKYIQKTTRYLVLALVVTFGLGLIIYSVKSHPASPAKAVSTYVVDSGGDEPDDNPGDDTCHTALNTCTLRAAIQEANAHTGADIINFNNAYTISPATELPDITDQVEVNGYTGSPGGATPNTAVAPNPFNGTLTVELDGTSAGASSGLRLVAGSSGSVIKGLVINDFGLDGIRLAEDNITIQGSYIGTSTNGMSAESNDGGIQQGLNDTDNAQIGGTNPADRNIISGNTSCGSSPNTNSDNWVYEGNYIGPAADGVTALGNGSSLGCGGLSIDNNSGTRIGGTSTGATNLISGNGGGGIQPDNASNMVIQGNYIGTNYTGNVALANGVTGINFSLNSSNNTIGGTSVAARNVISGNTESGINISDASNITILGNYIGLKADGSGVLANGFGSPNRAGLVITSSSNNIVGNGTSAGANYISGNTGFGIAINGQNPFGLTTSSNNTIQGNCIGTNASCEYENGFGNSSVGVALTGGSTNNLVGGIDTGDGNVIVGNGSGIANPGLVTDYPINNSFLRNSIFSNAGGVFSIIGIDNLQTNDFATFINQNVTLNDANDVDYSGTNTGPNHYLNFPVINSVTSSNGQVTINYNLDINDSETGATGYRVEFFANDSADPSGYGQGQTYLGFDTVAGDVTGRQVTLTLPNGYSGNKYISATTTMTDNSTDGFGHTSEFAADVQASLLPPTPAPTPNTNSSSLADTGQTQHSNQLVMLAILLIFTGCTTLSFTLIKLNR